tara:strand:- start:7088 stop:8290 length:1203 start_codon:yes stop_codon:yes gene_type:complete
MSIEDIAYMKDNCIKQSYIFVVDSKSRNKNLFPLPNTYVVDFDVPFKNVFAMEVIDVSIPKTMYNIDYNNNKFLFYINKNFENIHIDNINFTMIEIPVGNYTTDTFISAFQLLIKKNNIPGNFKIKGNSTPADLTNIIKFECDFPFILDMKNSTINETLGFDLYTNSNLNNINYNYENINSNIGYEKYFHSLYSNNKNIIIAPGMLYLINSKYILLKCPEIEEHLFGSLSYNKNSIGLAKLRINSYGYNDEKIDFFKVPLREFHPIGKLQKITLRFEENSGELYDFKGVNHNITFAIYYYEPKQLNFFTKSVLNPEYKIDHLQYMYRQEDQEGSSDEENNFSRDNIDLYKHKELLYSYEEKSDTSNEFCINEKNSEEGEESQESEEGEESEESEESDTSV